MVSRHKPGVGSLGNVERLKMGLCVYAFMVRLVRVKWFELNSLCVIAGSPVESVVRAWALVSGLQRGDAALDGRSGAVRTF